MGILDKVSQSKKMMQMIKQAKQLEKELDQEEITVTKGNLKIVITGSLKVKELEADCQDTSLLRDLINEAIKKAQKKAAKKAMSLGNMFGM